MERIAEMEAMREMITDQAENIKRKEVERDRVRDRKKRNQLSDHIKRLEKALIDDLRLYSSTIQKWNKDDQKHEKGYEADNEEGFGGGRRRTRRKKRTKRRRSSRRRSKKRRTRRRRKRRRGGTLNAHGMTKIQVGIRKKRGGTGGEVLKVM